MLDLAGTILRWLLRHFLSFVVIVLILLLAQWLRAELRQYQGVSTALAVSKSAVPSLQAQLHGAAQAAVARAAGLRSATLDGLGARIAAIELELRAGREQQQRQAALANVFSDVPIGQQLVDRARLDAEIRLLERERAYLEELKSFAVAVQSQQAGRAELERLRLAHRRVYDRLQANRQAQRELLQAFALAARIPATQVHDQLGGLQLAERSLLADNQRAHDNYQRQSKLVQGLAAVRLPDRFDLPPAEVEQLLQPLRASVAALEQTLDLNWISKMVRPVREVALAAAGILAGVILLPLAIKLLFYFVLAPLASRRAPICLDAGASGAMGLTGGSSAVSQRVLVDGQHELLIQPEYLQSASIQGSKDTQWLLNRSYPLSSLVSGMVALTRIRADSPQTYVVSATRDPLSEIGLLDLAPGSALVMQPHNLVGVLQPRGAPLRISRHWRLGSLHAWLTLQLRYLVFHGPAQLVVQGCRGVRVERADSGRSINQAATIGFGANLAYSTRRCETFVSYLLGKQELFNDYFAGDDGYYVYEEMPRLGQKTGLTGRGIEGLTDSLLKVFGV